MKLSFSLSMGLWCHRKFVAMQEENYVKLSLRIYWKLSAILKTGNKSVKNRVFGVLVICLIHCALGWNTNVKKVLNIE